MSIEKYYRNYTAVCRLRLLPGEEKLAAAIANMKEEKTVNEEET